MDDNDSAEGHHGTANVTSGDDVDAVQSPPRALPGWEDLLVENVEAATKDNGYAAFPDAPPNKSETPLSAKHATEWSAPPVPPQAPQFPTSGYLPPTQPPSTLVQSTPPANPRLSNSGWGWRALVAFVAGMVAMGAGFFANDVLQEDPLPVVVQSSAAEPTTELVDGSIVNATEAVANTLGPAVVQIETDVGLGSGVLYGDGLILTNAHVVAGSSVVQVKLFDGRVLPAEVAGAADTLDIAVVSVGPGQDLPVAQLATDSSVAVGQVAIAIGSPFELQQTVTQGIVSAVARPVAEPATGNITAMIQTDASMNPGNSGGALADTEGRVVGINTSIQTTTQGGVGVGFAIPIDTALNAADRIVAGEPFDSGRLGIVGGPSPDGSAGVFVEEVEAGSGAEVAGVQVGDRIIAINEAPVTSGAELAGLVGAHPPGDSVTLEFVRGAETLNVSVVLGNP